MGENTRRPPFFITREQPNGKLFARYSGGDITWTPSRVRAARFYKDDAQSIIADINRCASVPAVMERAPPQEERRAS